MFVVRCVPDPVQIYSDRMRIWPDVGSNINMLCYVLCVVR